MSRFLLMICPMLFAVSAYGQQLKSRDAGFEEYKVLLEAAGYQAFSFDLTEFLADDYNISVYIKEYEAGKEIDSRRFAIGANKLMLSDFAESDHERVLASGRMADAEAQIVSQAEKLVIGLYPSGVDSLVRIAIDVPGMAMFTDRLKLRALTSPTSVRSFYNYHSRPFAIDTFETGKLIPLVFYGSSWYDEKSNIFRFCGEREINPDLSSEIVEHVPHFYTLGVKITKK